jgi:hypothetical protein
MRRDLERRATEIANAIVALVEATDGPVSLCQVEREIQGFAEEEPPWWDYHIRNDGRDTVYWGRMTEAGSKALQKVIGGHRVAIQFVSPLHYLIFEEEVLDHPDCCLIVCAACASLPILAKSGGGRGKKRLSSMAQYPLANFVRNSSNSKPDGISRPKDLVVVR